jgi:hypothetical protein
MTWDWKEAGSGFAMGGVVGGIVGGLGIFGSSAEAPEEYNDPYKGRIDAGIRRMEQSDIGARRATVLSGQATHAAERDVERAQGGAMGGNLAAMKKFTADRRRGAQQTSQQAYLAGAQQDQATKERAMGMAQQQSATGYGRWREHQARLDEQASTPGFFEGMLRETISTGIGVAAGAATGGITNMISPSMTGGGQSGFGGSVGSGASTMQTNSPFGDANMWGFGGGSAPQAPSSSNFNWGATPDQAWGL